jgi:uncharacterized coiled-coil protein SlyX
LQDAQLRIVELEAALARKDAEIAARDARIQELEQLVAAQAQQIATLLKLVEQLTERVNRNSRNSNLPPSSNAPGSAAAGSRRNKGADGPARKRGGQPGHRGHHRELVPAERVDEAIDLFPPQCENCWAPLPQTPDPAPKRHQHTELPPIKPHTT